MKIILVRHGEAEHNVGLVKDDLQSRLTDKGKHQATITGKYLSKYTFDLVLTSALPRTIETAELILKENKHKPKTIKNLDIFNELGPRNLPKEVLDDADEIINNFKQKYQDDPIGYQREFRSIVLGLDKKYKIESLITDERNVDIMFKYLSSLKGKQILLVAHNGVIIELLNKIFSLPFAYHLKGFGIHPLGNCHISIIDYTERKWKLLLAPSTTHLYVDAHNMNVKEPWYGLIQEGKKTVEGRLLDDKRKKYKKGDYIKFNNQGWIFQIKKLTVYKTFKDMLISEGLSNVLPNVASLEDGIAVYKKYYNKEDEERLGVVAIRYN